MNEAHLQICGGDEWAEVVEQHILPWALRGADLGDDVLEVGPGPGRTTDVLLRTVPRLTAAEVDPHLAARLAERLAGTGVEVVEADATTCRSPTGGAAPPSPSPHRARAGRGCLPHHPLGPGLGGGRR